MANSLDMQIAEEGPRNAIIRFVGLLDTMNINEVPAITLQDFVNNDPNLNLRALRFDMIEYSIGPGLEVILEWDGIIPALIFPLSGRGRIFGSTYGGFSPPSAYGVGPQFLNGNINLKTRNFTPGVDGFGLPIVQNFSLVLEVIKQYDH